MYASNFGTGSRWFSYLVKLTDGRLVRRHQDHIRCRSTSTDGEQSNETPQPVPKVLETLVPVAPNEASTSPLAVPLEGSATSSRQDSPARRY